MKPVAKNMSNRSLLCHLLLLLSTAAAEYSRPSATSSILFTTLGRSVYNFDIFTLPLISRTTPFQLQDQELQLTDGKSVNHNGFFPSSYHQNLVLNSAESASAPPLQVVYVTERQGVYNIYFDGVYLGGDDSGDKFERRRRSVVEIGSRIQIPLLRSDEINGQISMKDRPSLSGLIVFHWDPKNHARLY